MPNSADILTDFVLAKLASEPLSVRATVYRALADVSGPRTQKRLLALAMECDALQAAHQQLVFDFQQARRPRPRKSN